MLAVIQRVSQAEVEINSQTVSQIGPGFLILLAVVKDDTQTDLDYLVKKISQLRIMADKNNYMNLSLKDTQGEILVVSQFTLAANTKKGNRPSFTNAADPQTGERFYNLFISRLKSLNLTVKSGRFAAYMQLNLTNDGPVTIIIDSKNP